MIGRVITTAILLLLAFYAFWGNALGAGRINPFGILFLVFAAVAWLKWEVIRDGFSTAKGESQLPIIRLAAKIISGMETLRSLDVHTFVGCHLTLSGELSQLRFSGPILNYKATRGKKDTQPASIFGRSRLSWTGGRF